MNHRIDCDIADLKDSNEDGLVLVVRSFILDSLLFLKEFALRETLFRFLKRAF